MTFSNLFNLPDVTTGFCGTTVVSCSVVNSVAAFVVNPGPAVVAFVVSSTACVVACVVAAASAVVASVVSFVVSSTA